MNKKRLLVTFCLLALAASALAVGRQGQAERQAERPASKPEIPDHVTYRHLFRHAAAFKKQAEEAESQGKNAAPFRAFFKNKAELNDEQANTLNEISAQCDEEIRALDERAKAIVIALRAPYPDGQLPHGQAPPLPPAELKNLRLERDAVVMRARERLRTAFGEAEFRRFDGYVKRNVASNIQQLSAGRAQSASPTDDQN